MGFFFKEYKTLLTIFSEGVLIETFKGKIKKLTFEEGLGMEVLAGTIGAGSVGPGPEARSFQSNKRRRIQSSIEV